MVLVPYVGKYFGRKCAYWGECDRVESPVVSFLTRTILLSWADGNILWGEREGKARGEMFELTMEFQNTGWAKFMQWKYPVEVVVTSKKTFNTTGAVEAAASL